MVSWVFPSQPARHLPEISCKPYGGGRAEAQLGYYLEPVMKYFAQADRIKVLGFIFGHFFFFNELIFFQ
jgi:hypothetical protein